jgi:hypothetical protein
MLFPLFDHNPHHRIPWFTLLIIVANVAVMWWVASADRHDAMEAVVHYGFVPQRLTELGNGKPVLVEFEDQPAPWQRNAQPKKERFRLQPSSGEVYLSFLTMMFLHGGWLHLASNMWMLWVFGNNIEDRLGHFNFVLYYLLGGVVATLAHWVVQPDSAMPVIGASGAVAAVLGGYAVTYPTAKVRTLIFVGIIFLWDLPALLVLGIWFAMEMVQGLGVLQGFNDAPIAFWAHIGGFITGMGLMPILGLGAPPADNDWQSETERMFQFDEPDRK